jgi:hypothetical protein
MSTKPSTLPRDGSFDFERALHAGQGGNAALESDMDAEILGEIIASRQFHYADDAGNTRTVSVFVGQPQPSPDANGYHCPFQVIGIGSQKTQLACGHDSIQALQSAMILIAARLNHLNDQLGGRLQWDGGCKGELGFP